MRAKMAWLAVLLAADVWRALAAPAGEADQTNITRFFAGGDLFSIPGTECGLTRCMEVSHGTALSTMGAGGDCVCQCHKDTPAYREDQRVCIDHLEECPMASFGVGAIKPQIPFVYLPLKGQIIYPAKEIIFTDVEDAICVVTSAQYLTAGGWLPLRDVLDNDVPFSLYRDEGKTFLQWRGSPTLHARLEGRLIAVHVLCSTQAPPQLASSCAAFRVAGTARNALLDVRSIPFHAGEVVTTEPARPGQGLSVLECLAIGVCVLMLIFVYAAGIVFYIHYKKRQRRKQKDTEMNHINGLSDGDALESRIDVDNVRLKKNPLLNLENLGPDFDGGLSDVSERTEETLDSSPNNTQKFQKQNPNMISAMVHTRRKKPVRPSIRAPTTPESTLERFLRRSASPDLERAPQSELAIVDSRFEHDEDDHDMSNNADPVLRKKLYFNPVFFETEHLKNPPPAAVDFLNKIREVMSIAKEKMTNKRFVPILSDIPEEELYHTIDLGWDIPCARRGRRFSAISLKRENSRRAVHCGGCPGCDNIAPEPKVTLARSNSCKSCVSDDYKQKIVRKWLDEVPTNIKSNAHGNRPTKSVAKVSGTPRVVEPKVKIDPAPVTRNVPLLPQPNPIAPPVENKNIKIDTKTTNSKEITISMIDENMFNKVDAESNVAKSKSVSANLITAENKLVNTSVKTINHATRRVRRKLPPPPPPPIEPPRQVIEEEAPPMPLEIKKKMHAVIQELNQCRRDSDVSIENTENNSIPVPKLVIPVFAAEFHYFSDDNMLLRDTDGTLDKDTLNKLQKRRFSVACGPEIQKNHKIELKSTLSKSSQNSQSWRDLRNSVDGRQFLQHGNNHTMNTENKNARARISEIFINSTKNEPIYDNMSAPGPLTIQVRGSPIEHRKKVEQFDPDTLDRKPKQEHIKKVERILLKSAGSFKYKSATNSEEDNNSTDAVFNRKIGSLRQIYQARVYEEDAKFHNGHNGHHGRRGSISYDSDDITTFISSGKTPDLLKSTQKQGLKPPVPPKHRHNPDNDYYFRNNQPSIHRHIPEERPRFQHYNQTDLTNARKSGRKSTRTRSRRTDLRKLHRTEDSGYLSTDSNESKRRASYLMHMKHRGMPQNHFKVMSLNQKVIPQLLHIETDTDELESLCDGHSESGGESVETDSVFFGHFDETQQMYTNMGISEFDRHAKMTDQIDSGFAGEVNIILSGDSDSEHKSVISIVAGCDGRASASSIATVDGPYTQSVEC